MGKLPAAFITFLSCNPSMPLRMDAYAGGRWVFVAKLGPGQPCATLSDNKPDGSRDIYKLECLPDDSGSVVYRSRAGVDADLGDTRIVFSLEFEKLAVLTEGDKPYEMGLRTDRSPEARRVRFSHE